jgi:hypothetical protein
VKIVLEPTDLIVPLGGLATRRWKGETDGGVKIVACIALITVRAEADAAAFERELLEIARRDVPLADAAIRRLADPL